MWGRGFECRTRSLWKPRWGRWDRWNMMTTTNPTNRKGGGVGMPPQKRPFQPTQTGGTQTQRCVSQAAELITLDSQFIVPVHSLWFKLKPFGQSLTCEASSMHAKRCLPLLVGISVETSGVLLARYSCILRESRMLPQSRTPNWCAFSVMRPTHILEGDPFAV